LLDSYWTIACTAAAAIVVAVAGGVLTEIGPWYRNLKKPSWQPPDWAFGPVWTVILVMAAISAALAWEAAPDAGAKTIVFIVLLVNSILNIAWSAIFFKMKRPDWALIEVALLWLSILALILVLGSYSTTAGLLMVPYIVWVSIASFLNFRIVQMNRPFA
jgi:tryptophan-rich sensory protein